MSEAGSTEYKKHHDKVATMVHWELCRKYGFEYAKHWFKHRVEAVMENQDGKILWDVNIRTNRVIEARRPDIVLIEKKNKETFIFDVAIPGDFCVRDKEAKNISMWNTKTRVIPIMIGALGAESLLTKYLAPIGVMARKGDSLQRNATLEPAHILVKFLSIPA